MSEADEEAAEIEPEDPRDRLPSMKGRRNLEMDVFGWALFIGILIILIPLLPALLLALALAKLFGFSGDRKLSWRRPQM